MDAKLHDIVRGRSMISADSLSIRRLFDGRRSQIAADLQRRAARSQLLPATIGVHRELHEYHLGDDSSELARRYAGIPLREPISALERRLPANAFVRVSRSAIVNLSAIREVQRWCRGNFVVILRDGTKVTTGARYRGRLAARLPL